MSVAANPLSNPATQAAHVSKAVTSYPGAADLAHGYLITTEFSSLGGTEVHTDTERTAGQVLMTKHIKHDHPEIAKAVSAIFNKGYIIMREFCSPTFSGMYFCPAKRFAELDNAIQELRDAAYILNQECAERGSPRQTVVEIYPFKVDPENPRVALRIGRAIHEHLTVLRNSYGSQRKNEFTMQWRMCRNMDDMLVGYQHEVVRAALLSAEAQRQAMNEVNRMNARRRSRIVAANENRTPSEIRNDLPAFDYAPIDAAIALFAPAAEY